MKRFKQLDLSLQLLLILTCLFAGFINSNYLFISFSILIGWQLLSIAVHEARLWFMQTKRRRYYHITLLFVLFTTVLFAFRPFFYAIPLLVGAAFCIIAYYFILSYWEWQALHKRPLSILK